MASVCGSATASEFALGLHELVKRRGAFGLDHSQSRDLADEAELAQFAQRLSECRRVAEIAAGQHNPIRRIPIALVQHFEDDRFLAFNAKRIDGIEQVNAEPVGQHAHQRQDLIEVGLHLKSARAVFQGLRQLAVRNIAVRDEDNRIQARGAGIGRHGCGRVAGGNACHALAIQPNGLRDAARHAVVLERSGGIEALMLERQAIQSAVSRRARSVQQWRVALAQRNHLMMMAVERQQFAVAPHAALFEQIVGCAPRAPDLLPQLRFHALFGENHFEQAPTIGTIVDGFINRKARAAMLLETRQLS